MMLDWEAALTDRCCRLQVIISFIIMIMSEDQRSDIKGKQNWNWEVIKQIKWLVRCAGILLKYCQRD